MAGLGWLARAAGVALAVASVSSRVGAQTGLAPDATPTPPPPGHVLLRGGGDAGQALAVDAAGVRVIDAGVEYVIGWDRVARVDGPLADQAAAFGDLATESWRARARLERGDAVAAEPLYEELFDRLDQTKGPTALAICEGLLRCRLWRGALASAVEPWLQWVRLAGDDASLTTAGAGLDPAVVHRVRAWPMALLPVIDTPTGLVTSLPPVWMPGPSVRAMVAGGPTLLGSIADGPGAERARLLAELYLAAARHEGGDRRDAPIVTSSDPGVRLVSDMVLARVGDNAQRDGARQALSARVSTELPAWQEAWCRAAIGRSMLEESDPEKVMLGVVELMHLPARFGEEQPYLAGVALADSAQALARLGMADEAVTLDRLLLSRYASHPAMESVDLTRVQSGASAPRVVPAEDLPTEPPSQDAGGNDPKGGTGRDKSARQPVDDAEGVFSPDDQLESFLEDQGLRHVLAAQLRRRLALAPPPDRLALAERLSKIYVELMGDARTTQELATLETFSQSLLDAVPDAEAYALKVDLAKARYLQAESVVEDSILRLATPESLREAERIMRSVLTTFDQIGTAVHRRVEILEAQEERGRLDGDEAGRQALADARRLRSLSHYYAGWTRYYLAVVSSNPSMAREALVDFGWLLNAPPGQAATVDRLPKALLKYEHIARAAMGCALAASLQGNSVEAIRWLEEVDGAEDLSGSVRDQLFERRIQVLCASRRWADLTWQVERVRRQRAVGAEPGRLSVREARLLAIGTLEALKESGAPRERVEVAEQLAQGALADLVLAGEVAHVLDLVQRYGTAPIGEQGFIVAYVRGLQTYNQARTAHQASGQDPSKPATEATLINAYRQAGDLLEAALNAQDTRAFEPERAQCGIVLGFSRFYAGDYEAAADALEHVATTAPAAKQGEEALWVAIVALDEAVEQGRPSLTERRDRLALLFLEQYPSSPRAAELLVRRAASGLIDDEPAVQILLAVERTSPLYPAARRHAAGLLYRLYRRSAGPERDFAAIRFADVAEEVVRMDRDVAATAQGQDATDAVNMVVLRGRQILDALLGASAPDLPRAEAMLDLVERTLAQAGPARPPELDEELAFRRVQIALSRGDEGQIASRLDALRAMNGPLARTADRMIYARAARAWALAPEEDGLARAVVASGQRVIAQFPEPPEAFNDPGAPAIYAAVAEAAATVWSRAQDPAFRDIAIKLDSALVDHGRATASGLRRLAQLAESAGDTTRALDCWVQLLSGLPASSPGWFEARFESLRLLAASDPDTARRAMDQHKILYPDYGPDPWGERLRDLDTQMPGAPPARGGS